MRAGGIRPVQALREFLQLESAGGMLLIGADSLLPFSATMVLMQALRRERR